MVFLDNSDQRDSVVQESTFLVAQEIAEHWPATVFVTLRPETFHRSMRAGVLSGYHPKAFTIAPPRVDKVIEKRIEFGLQVTSGAIALPTQKGPIEVRLSVLDKLLRIFSQSINRSPDIMECIDNIAGGNVRFALDIIRSFFGSGHVDTDKMVDRYDAGGRYFIPLHEFLRALIFGDASYYHSDSSPIANLFDVSTADPKDHFSLPILLDVATALESASSGSGFVDTGMVYERMQGIGFSPYQIDMAIARATDHRMIDVVAATALRGDTAVRSVRITTVGAYHIRRLCSQFTYMDAVIVDTPVLEQRFRSEIHNVDDIEQRLRRVMTFSDYLTACWESVDAAGLGFKWNQVADRLQADVKVVAGNTRSRTWARGSSRR